MAGISICGIARVASGTSEYEMVGVQGCCVSSGSSGVDDTGVGTVDGIEVVGV